MIFWFITIKLGSVLLTVPAKGRRDTCPTVDRLFSLLRFLWLGFMAFVATASDGDLDGIVRGCTGSPGAAD